MKAWEMFKSVFSENCPEYLTRPDYDKYQICTLEKWQDTLLLKLMGGEVRVNI